MPFDPTSHRDVSTVIGEAVDAMRSLEDVRAKLKRFEGIVLQNEIDFSAIAEFPETINVTPAIMNGVHQITSAVDTIFTNGINAAQQSKIDALLLNTDVIIMPRR